jgi:acyl-coenzyme A synthetase/AMP-(fatty) acid ligase
MFLNLDKKGKNAIAIVDDHKQELTYGDMCDFADDFRRMIPKRTLIFILSDNVIGSLLGYIAALSAKIVPLILSRNTDALLYQRLFDIYHPEYLWIPEDMTEQLGYATPLYQLHGYALVATGFTPESLYEELALLLPTSGSTGSPKLVRHSYRNIEANACNVSLLFNITSSDRPIVSLPMHYTMGLSVITSHLYAGATLYLTNKSLADREFWDMMKKGKVTTLTGVPYSFEILQKLRFFRMDLPDLKIITQGGGKLSYELFKCCGEYAQKNGKKFIATYGQTEGTARMAFLKPEMALEKIGSIGMAIPNGRLSVVDNEGNETFEGEATGEMIYRGENVTLGYALDGVDLAKGDENNGCLYTGDIVHRDAEGYYFIVGRMKRFLKIFGLRVSLDEIEYLIKSNFETDCVCSGSDDMLDVMITNPHIRENVSTFVIEKTHLYHKNVAVIAVEKIERNEAGKVILSK